MEENLSLSKRQKVIGIVMVLIFLVGVGYFVYSRTTLLPFGKGLDYATRDTSFTEYAAVENPLLESVLFCDLSLPECYDMHYTLLLFQEDFPNDLSITFAYYPTTENGKKAAIAALVARTLGKEVVYLDTLFDYLEEWYDAEDPIEQFNLYAAEAGLHEEEFANALANALNPASDIYQTVENGIKKAQSIGVSTVPTVYLNNKKVEEPVTSNFLEARLTETQPDWYKPAGVQDIDPIFDPSVTDFVEDPYDPSEFDKDPIFEEE